MSVLKKSSHYKYIMDNLNLDIDTYSDRELEKLFSLDAGKYVRSSVLNGKKILLAQLNKQRNLGAELRRNIEMFIDTASNKLSLIADNTDVDKKSGTWAMKHSPLMEGSGNNYIIDNPNTVEGRNSKIVDGRMGGTDETPPGWLNPINIRTLLVGMNIDSRFRPNYYSSSASDFTVQLPNVMRKVTNMRIATIEMPMSFYGINRAIGNSTMTICSAYTMPVVVDPSLTASQIIINPATYDAGHPLSDTSTDCWIHPAINGADTTVSQLTWGPGTHVVQMDFPDAAKGVNADSTQTVLTVLRTAKRAPIIIDVHSYKHKSEAFGTGEVERHPMYSGVAESAAAINADYVGVVLELGWIVTLPDGNYEMSWQGGNNSADITEAMNNAFASAIPGFIDTRDGTFWAFAQPVHHPTTGDLIAYLPYLKYGIRSKHDLCYSVDRRNGRSLITIPTGKNSSNTIPAVNPTADNFDWKYYKMDTTNPPNSCFRESGFLLHFVSSGGGSLVFDENIQLFLGWQLGFRAGHYKCDIISAGISEGICLPCGPRYMYLSIDDGLKSSGSNFIAAFAESTLDENVMTRINLSNTLDDVGVYKCASDVGLSNQLNRTREYFGPVDISRLRCRLLDEYGRIIDLNNMDWSMSIVFEKLYD